MLYEVITGTHYYYLFNNTTTNSMMPNSYAFRQYKTKDIEAQWITLEGEGVPYALDALTGEITQLGQYRDNGDGTISILLDGLRITSYNVCYTKLLRVRQTGEESD